jgi:hypothetical protein
MKGRIFNVTESILVGRMHNQNRVSTIFTMLFGAIDRLKHFWHNIPTM